MFQFKEGKEAGKLLEEGVAMNGTEHDEEGHHRRCIRGERSSLEASSAEEHGSSIQMRS